MTEASEQNIELMKQRMRQAVDEKRKKLEKARHREHLTENIHKLKVHLNMVDQNKPMPQPTAEERRINRIKQRFREIKKLQKQQQRPVLSMFACIPTCGAMEDEE